MVLFPDPEERNTRGIRPKEGLEKPLVALLWEQENFRGDGEEAIEMKCTSLDEYEDKYRRLIEVWDTLRNASVIDRNEGRACPAELAEQVTAFAQNVMSELIRTEDALGLD